MAKRRFQAASAEDKEPEELTPQERRARRKAQRDRSARAKKPKDDRPFWRRAALPAGGIAAAVVVVVVLLVLGAGHLFQPPCLSLTAIPDSSGIPGYPPANTTDFTRTWCPNAAFVFEVSPYLQITINGQTVSLPPAIGKDSNFTGSTCTLPITTSAPSAGVPNGVFTIGSAWAYEYTLADFFSEWQSSYVSAYVNSTYSTRSIDYTSTQFLGLPVDAKHTLTLYVDGQPSSAGPNLALDTLDNLPNPYPSCMGTVYGTGHTIQLQYKLASASAAVPIPGGPTHAPGDGTRVLVAPAPVPIAPQWMGSGWGASDLRWLSIRPFG